MGGSSQGAVLGAPLLCGGDRLGVHPGDEVDEQAEGVEPLEEVGPGPRRFVLRPISS